METNAQDVQGADEAQTQDQLETEVEGENEGGSGSPTDGNAAEKEKSDGFTKRIDELTKQFRKEQRERAQERMARERVERELEQIRTQRTERPEETQVKTLEDFEYDQGKYSQYLFQISEERAVKRAREELSKAEEKRTSETRMKGFLDRESKYAEKFDDYYEVTRDSSLPITQAIVEATQEADNGPELLYHLGKNPEIADKLARMSPSAAARELGRIEAKLEYEREKAAAAAAAAKVSKAPEPTAKVENSSATRTVIDPTSPESDKLSDDEWVRAENKRLQKLRKRA